MVAYDIKFQLCFPLPLSFHLPCLTLLCLLVWPPHLSGSILLPGLSFPPSLTSPPSGRGTPFRILSKLYQTAASLVTFCWVATFKALKFSKSLIVCPNLERRSIRNNKPKKQNILRKSSSWRIWSGYSMTVDKEWRRLFKELPITIYWVLRAVGGSEMNKAWSLPLRSSK